MNLCSSNEETRNNGLKMFRQDMERMEFVTGHYYNFHPGSHTGLGAEKGIELIAEGLNAVLRPEMNTTILLETMAGKAQKSARALMSCRRSSTE